jgi:amidophosphoribosyltransferase
MGYEGRDPTRPQFTDHCFTGDYPTPLTDLKVATPRKLAILAEAD